jgi:hypothetical protein
VYGELDAAVIFCTGGRVAFAVVVCRGSLSDRPLSESEEDCLVVWGATIYLRQYKHDSGGGDTVLSLLSI